MITRIFYIVAIVSCVTSTLLHAQSPVIRENYGSSDELTASDISLEDFRYTPQQNIGNFPGEVLSPFQNKAGIAFLSSAIVPGSGQLFNKKWVRGGIYLAAEILAVSLYIDRQNKAERHQREYENFVDDNWSVVKYARWLVDFNQHHKGITIPYDSLSTPGHTLTDPPDYRTSDDWERVDLEELRRMERNTIFYNSDPNRPDGAAFSHVLPDYGSQQYYELVSKYLQFGPGWNDYPRPGNNPLELNWTEDYMPDNWFKGAQLAEQFNDEYRFARNMVTLMIANHLISAFDAMITVKLKESKIQPSFSLTGGRQFSFTYKF